MDVSYNEVKKSKILFLAWDNIELHVVEVYVKVGRAGLIVWWILGCKWNSAHQV